MSQKVNYVHWRTGWWIPTSEKFSIKPSETSLWPFKPPASLCFVLSGKPQPSDTDLNFIKKVRREGRIIHPTWSRKKDLSFLCRVCVCVCVCVSAGFLPPWCSWCVCCQRWELPEWAGGLPPAGRSLACSWRCSSRTGVGASAGPPGCRASRWRCGRFPAESHAQVTMVYKCSWHISDRERNGKIGLKLQSESFTTSYFKLGAY